MVPKTAASAIHAGTIYGVGGGPRLGVNQIIDVGARRRLAHCRRLGSGLDEVAIVTVFSLFEFKKMATMVDEFCVRPDGRHHVDST